MKVSIIIPCYNEIKTLEKIIDKVNLQNLYDKEIIIIDDYSTDGTREIIENNIKKKVQKIILNNKNFGKGYSLRKGIEAATGDIILIQDADLEYDPSDYQKLIEPIKKDTLTSYMDQDLLVLMKKEYCFFGIALVIRYLLCFQICFLI
jgi:glycosyltransferase involved in cell wall biosynthesis